jgi:hypothetical protein
MTLIRRAFVLMILLGTAAVEPVLRFWKPVPVIMRSLK